MDENVKNDAKQVMLVQNADDGRLQAVTGVDRDGNIQTADPTDQNVASLLNVNTQDSALEAFFKKFMEQAQNPVHTGIFVMTENALNKLIRIDFDPEIQAFYERVRDYGTRLAKNINRWRPASARRWYDAGAAAVRAAGRHEDRPGGYGEERYPHGGHRAAPESHVLRT